MTTVWEILRIFGLNKKHMKKKLRVIYVAVLILQTVLCTAQYRDIVEQFHLNTDRTTYLTGDKIYFSVRNHSSDIIKNSSWSKTYYTELISPAGRVHAATKLFIDDDIFGSSLIIPGNLPSGTYYLRGYTRWIANAGPSNFNYISILILNPFSDKIQTVDTVSNTDIFQILHDTKNRTRLKNQPASKEGDESRILIERQDPGFRCNSISVYRSEYRVNQYQSIDNPVAILDTSARIIPETRGVSIHGTIIDAVSKKPAPFSKVFISTLDRNRKFFCNYADSLGRFHIAFPEEKGKIELFISARNDKSDSLDILIESDFIRESISLPSYPLPKDPVFYEDIKVKALLSQIHDQYQSTVNTENPDVDIALPNLKFFYSNPSKILYFDDYIKLPVLEEYFIELMPQVSIRKHKGKKRLIINGSNPDLRIYEPLVLVDGVAVFNTEAILNISPRYIQRIELLDEPYIHGNITFGGVMNIISRKDDLGYVNLPSSGILLNYQMSADEAPAGIISINQQDTPAASNALYWNIIQQDESGEIPVQLPGGMTRGTYTIRIQGECNGEYCSELHSFDLK